jgi:hypothetical protein
MADWADTRWTAELTRERWPDVVQRAEWAMQHQLRRRAQRHPLYGVSTRARQLAGVALSVLGMVMVLQLWPDRGFRPIVVCALIVFGTFLVMSLFVEQVRAWLRRQIGRRIPRTVAHALRPIESKLPVTLAYELQDDHIAVQCDALPGLRPIPIARGCVLDAGDALYVLGSVYQPHPRAIYGAGDAERRAVLDAFARCGADIVAITGPLDEYADRLPRATARRGT